MTAGAFAIERTYLDALEEDQDDLEIIQAELDAEEHARCERLAEALALLDVCRTMHVHRRTVVDAAVDRLAIALEDVIAAREGYTEAGDLLVEAMRLVVLARGGVV